MKATYHCPLLIYLAAATWYTFAALQEAKIVATWFGQFPPLTLHFEGQQIAFHICGIILEEASIIYKNTKLWYSMVKKPSNLKFYLMAYYIYSHKQVP